MRDIFIRYLDEVFVTKTSNYFSSNSWALARNRWLSTGDDRFWTTPDVSSVLGVVLLDGKGEIRATSEAVAVVEAARATLPEDLQHVFLRATTSEAEIETKASKKSAAAQTKAAKKADLMSHLEEADEKTIASAYDGCSYLAALDADMATLKNGRGFGHPDAKDGHRLAGLPDYSREPEDDARALQIARKYRSQLPPLLNFGLGIWTREQSTAAGDNR